MTAGRLGWFTGLCILLCAAGCRTNRNQELLESELRTKEIQYRDLLDEHEKTAQQSLALQREIEAIRKGWKVSPEQAAQIFPVKHVTLGRLTGGQDTDNKTGDDALMLILEPRDANERIVKAPGILNVTVLEVNSQGLKVPTNSWTVSADELRRSWKSGLFSSGYFLTLPWKSYPLTENLRIVIRLTIPDGRVFEADKDIRVRLVPGAHVPRIPADLMGPLPPPLDLHMPRPAEDQGRMPPPSTIAPASTANWQPAPLDDAVKLQRPRPVGAD